MLSPLISVRGKSILLAESIEDESSSQSSPFLPLSVSHTLYTHTHTHTHTHTYCIQWSYRLATLQQLRPVFSLPFDRHNHGCCFRLLSPGPILDSDAAFERLSPFTPARRINASRLLPFSRSSAFRFLQSSTHSHPRFHAHPRFHTSYPRFHTLTPAPHCRRGGRRCGAARGRPCDADRRHQCGGARPPAGDGLGRPAHGLGARD